MHKFYNLLLVTFPILSVYISPIPGIDLGTFICLIFGFCAILDPPYKAKFNGILGILLIYTFLSTLLLISTSETLYSSFSSILNRMFRFCLILGIMLELGYNKYFDKYYFFKCLRVMSLIVAGYAILQILFFNFTGLKLINVFGPTKQEVVFSAALNKYETTYRPPSLFLEPSSAAYYLAPFLCFALFNNFYYKKQSTQWIDCAVLSIGIITTTSGQGLIMLIICWTIWFLSNLKKLKIPSILFFIFAFVVIFIIYKDNINFTIERFSDTGNAVEARAGGFEAISDIGFEHFIFGTGFGNYIETIYYSSFAEIIFCQGLVGLMIVIAMYLAFFIKGNLSQKTLVISSMVLMMGGGIYTASFLVLYLPVLISKLKNA